MQDYQGFESLALRNCFVELDEKWANRWPNAEEETSPEPGGEEASSSPSEPQRVQSACEGLDVPGLVLNVRRVFSDDGDRAQAEALSTAVAALLSANLSVQARPLVDELVALIKTARGPRAEVIALAFRRDFDGGCRKE